MGICKKGEQEGSWGVDGEYIHAYIKELTVHSVLNILLVMFRISLHWGYIEAPTVRVIPINAHGTFQHGPVARVVMLRGAFTCRY